VNVYVVPTDEIVPVTCVPACGPLATATKNVAAVIVDEFMASLNVTETVVVVRTSVEPYDGLTALTIGGIGPGPAVANDEKKSADMALPAASIAPVVTVTL
jgi:hypothetical protein